MKTRPGSWWGVGSSVALVPALASFFGIAACTVDKSGLEVGPHPATSGIPAGDTAEGSAGAGGGVGGSGEPRPPGNLAGGSGGRGEMGSGGAGGAGAIEAPGDASGGRTDRDTGGSGSVDPTGGQVPSSGTGGVGGGGRPGSGGAATAGAAAEVVAFPGAVGVGRLATGGRRTTVVHVTNLADDGPGSFRVAVGTPGRIVVFDVGGYIMLSTRVHVSSNITIAGQTAPGDGVGIMGREVTLDGSSNVIVRYLRIRQGDLDPDTGASSINLSNAAKVILDHVSVEFGQFHDILSVGASSITIQNSMVADPLGEQLAVWADTGPYTFYANLFANLHNHGPRALADTQFVDNVIYNFQAAYTTGDDREPHSHDLVHNSFIAGPSTTRTSNWFYQVNLQRFYLDGNSGDASLDGKLNGTAMGVPTGAIQLAAPWSPATASLQTTSAADAYSRALATAGASLHRDQVDALVIADVVSLGNSGRLFNSQNDTGLANRGYGMLTGAAAPVDTDRDGMPDSWETRVGLDPSNPADANADPDGNGYTSIEEYVNAVADGSR
jgi:hypothetical protein